MINSFTRSLGSRFGITSVNASNHTIVLGFVPGEYTIFKEMIDAADGDNLDILVVSEYDEDEVIRLIMENVAMNGRTKLACKTSDICNPQALIACSLANCKGVLINTPDDRTTIKVLLAVTMAAKQVDRKDIFVGAYFFGNEYIFPYDKELTNVHVVYAKDYVPRMTARAAVLPGAASVYRELLGFEGCEFYITKIDKAVGQSFSDYAASIENAVLAGIVRDGRILVNPKDDVVIKDSDEILVWSVNEDSAGMEDKKKKEPVREDVDTFNGLFSNSEVVIIGYNYSIGDVLRQLPDSVPKVKIADVAATYRDKCTKGLPAELSDKISFVDDIDDYRVLEDLAQTAGHFIIMYDYRYDSETADMRSIQYILKLRDIRNRFEYLFNITAQMQCEYNRRLVQEDNASDFVTASNIGAMMITQYMKCPRINKVFDELLGSDGNEIMIKSADELGLAGMHTISQIRELAYRNGYIFMGYIEGLGESRFCLDPNDSIVCDVADRLIVIGK